MIATYRLSNLKDIAKLQHDIEDTVGAMQKIQIFGETDDNIVEFVRPDPRVDYLVLQDELTGGIDTYSDQVARMILAVIFGSSLNLLNITVDFEHGTTHIVVIR